MLACDSTEVRMSYVGATVGTMTAMTEAIGNWDGTAKVKRLKL